MSTQRKSKRISERRLVDVLVSHLRKSTAVAREVRHYEKRIDVVSVDPTSGIVTAIEVKTHAWPRAVGQAVVNLPAAERSYVALYSKHVHRVPHETLAEHGVGLIAIGTAWGDVEVIVEAPESPYQNRLLIDRLRNTLLNRPR